MEPAMPDWRAFGQPVAAAPAEPEPPAGRPTPAEMLARLPRSTRIALLIAAAVVVGGLVLAFAAPSGGGVALDEAGMLPAGAAVGVVDGPAVPVADAAPALVVDVAGAVPRPGLVRLATGSRVGDAIAAAGGYAATADLAAAARDLNLAAPLTDGAKVLVPALGDGAVAGAGPAAGGATGGGRLDLNAATQAELEDLPGIGPVTAARILEARGQAPFATVDELRSRGLVGESVFTKLRDLVTVGG